MSALSFYRLSLTDWQEPEPEELSAGKSLSAGEVQLWLAGLDSIDADRQVLSPEEVERSHKYKFEKDARRFATRRTILRQLLGAYLGQPPAEITFEVDALGKLHVAGDLQFNLSVAGGLALFGFVRGHSIGVDLTERKSDFQWREVMESFFHPAEIAHINGLPATEQGAAFYRLWTIKEAFVKADGGGLSLPLAQEDFTLQLRDGVQTRGAWRWLGWEPTSATVASLVVHE